MLNYVFEITEVRQFRAGVLFMVPDFDGIYIVNSEGDISFLKMGGKIVGHFILGIIQLVAWSLLALPVAWYFFDLEIGTFLLRPILPLLLLFALLGFFMFAALFVGIGATMEDMQSASNTQGMVFMLP